MMNFAGSGARLRTIDLSLLLAEELPASWPGHMPFRHQIGNWFEDRPDLPQPLGAPLGGYQTRWMLIDEHTGTHLDAPSHGLRPDDERDGAMSVGADRVPLDQCQGEAILIDAHDNHAGDHFTVGIEAIRAHEREHGVISEGSIPLLRTGWDSRYVAGAGGSEYVATPLNRQTRGWPAFSADAISLLADRGVRCAGTDAPSIGAANTGGPTHDVGFRRGMVFVEALANLCALPTRGAYFMALPLRLRDGTGSPVRAVAFVEDEVSA